MKKQFDLIREFLLEGKEDGYASNLTLEGDRLLSYGWWPIAFRDGEGGIWFRTDRYSMSTSSQQSILLGCLSSYFYPDGSESLGSDGYWYRFVSRDHFQHRGWSPEVERSVFSILKGRLDYRIVPLDCSSTLSSPSLDYSILWDPDRNHLWVPHTIRLVSCEEKDGVFLMGFRPTGHREPVCRMAFDRETGLQEERVDGRSTLQSVFRRLRSRYDEALWARLLCPSSHPVLSLYRRLHEEHMHSRRKAEVA